MCHRVNIDNNTYSIQHTKCLLPCLLPPPCKVLICKTATHSFCSAVRLSPPLHHSPLFVLCHRAWFLCLLSLALLSNHLFFLSPALAEAPESCCSASSQRIRASMVSRQSMAALLLLAGFMAGWLCSGWPLLCVWQSGWVLRRLLTCMQVPWRNQQSC